MHQACVGRLHPVVLLLLLMTGTTRADDLQQCKSVPEANRADCDQQVKAKCASIANYWDRRHCEDGISRAVNPCLSPAWFAACDDFRKSSQELCGLKAEVPTYSRPEQLTTWTERAKAFPAFAEKGKSFIASWSACFGTTRSDSCSATVTAHLTECKGSRATYQKGWVGVLDAYVHDTAKNAFAAAKRGLDSNRYEETLMSLRNVAATLEEGETLLEMNKVPLIATSSAEVQATLDRLKETKDALQAHAGKNLSEARCPKATVKNAALEGTLRPLLARDGWKIGLVNLQSEPVSFRVGPAERTLVEEVTAFISYKANDDKCYVTHARFRRSKPDDAAWNTWAMLPGWTAELLCSNLTK